MAQKNFSVSEFVVMVNNMLIESPEAEKDSRLGMISVLESVLHKTNNYNGFRYQAGVVDFTNMKSPKIVGDETRRIYSAPRG